MNIPRMLPLSLAIILFSCSAIHAESPAHTDTAQSMSYDDTVNYISSRVGTLHYTRTNQFSTSSTKVRYLQTLDFKSMPNYLIIVDQIDDTKPVGWITALKLTRKIPLYRIDTENKFAITCTPDSSNTDFCNVSFGIYNPSDDIAYERIDPDIYDENQQLSTTPTLKYSGKTASFRVLSPEDADERDRLCKRLTNAFKHLCILAKIQRSKADTSDPFDH